MTHAIDQIHCLYCAYANGVLGFARTVAAETERYWCPIRHTMTKGFQSPPHHQGFVEEGKEKDLRDRITKRTA